MKGSDNLRGIALMTGSMALFALEDTLVKMTSASIPTSQVLIMLGLSGSIIFGLWCWRRGDPIWSDALFHPAVAIRNLSELLGTFCFVTAIVLLPLATASAVFQAAPLLVTLGAVLFLGADVGWRRWSAMIIGFAGVLIIIRPGMEGFEPTSLLALAATVFLAARDLATRRIPPQISSPQLATYGFAMAGLAGVLQLPFWGAPVWPTSQAWAGLGGALCFGVVGYYAITAAMRVGEIAVVTPFRYTRLLFAIIMGFIVFHERPDLWTLLGAALILGSGLYTLAREQRAPSRPLSTAPMPRYR